MTYHKSKSTGNKNRFNSNSKSNKSNQNSRFSNNRTSENRDRNTRDEDNNNNDNRHKFNRDNGKNFNSMPDRLKKNKPTAEENKQFAIKGNYTAKNKKRDLDKKSFDKQDENRPPQRSNNRFNDSTRNFSGNDLLNRYDKFFGNGTSSKLKDAMRQYSNNQFIRVNLSKMNLDEIQVFFKKNRVKFENTFLKNAFKIEKTFFNLSSSIQCLTGQFYFQDLASQVPVNCVDFEKLKSLNRVVKVLDGCASPGSKTTQMLDLLNFHKIEYELTAIELEEKRVNRLVNNIQKMGFDRFKIINCSATDFKTSDKYDVIILDVPCSGNLVGDKNWLNKRNVSDICDKSNLQKSIVKNISKYLSDEGELIYSTCSIEPEENEDNVKWIIDNCDLKNVKIDLEVGFDASCLNGVLGLRFLPHKSRTQGFFVSKFVR